MLEFNALGWHALHLLVPLPLHPRLFSSPPPPPLLKNPGSALLQASTMVNYNSWMRSKIYLTYKSSSPTEQKQRYIGVDVVLKSDCRKLHEFWVTLGLNS